MCGSADTVFPGVTLLPGASTKAGQKVGLLPETPAAPATIRSDPKGDQAAIDAAAAAAAGSARTQLSRRRRFSSLLATGGAGDATNVVTGQPVAKPTLGA